MYQSKPKYLRLHGKKWHFKVRLTKELQQHSSFKGKTHFVKSLGTDSLQTALAKRDQYLAWLHDLTTSLSNNTITSQSPFPSEPCLHTPTYVQAKVPPPEATLKEALEKTLEIKQGVIQNSEIKRYENSFKAFKSFLNKQHINLESIRRQHVTGFVQYQRNSLTDKTILGHLNRLSVMFNTALDFELVKAKNPFKGHRLSAKPTQRRSNYYPKHIKAIYQSLPDDCKLAWKICYFTGLRAGELFQLDKNSLIECESATGTVLCLQVATNGGKTENATRLVPVHNAIKDDLKDFSGFPVSQTAFKNKRSKSVLKLYGSEFAKSHDTHSLRHTFITTLVDALGNAELVEWLVGHSRSHRRSTTYQNYFHGFGLDKLNQAVQLMPNIFED